MESNSQVINIINAVLDCYGISATALMSRRRTALLIDARMLATALLVEDLHLNAKTIAQILQRDRTTIVYYIQNYRWRRLPIKDCRKLLAHDS